MNQLLVLTISLKTIYLLKHFNELIIDKYSPK